MYALGTSEKKSQLKIINFKQKIKDFSFTLDCQQM